MRLLLAVVALSLAVPAEASWLVVTKRGIAPARLFVNGTAYGKLKGKKPTEVELPEGRHEVVIAREDSATYLACVGAVDVPASGNAEIAVRDIGCEGIVPSRGNGGTILRGGLIRVRSENQETYFLSIDGGRAMAFGDDVLLNVSPGPHALSLYESVTDDIPRCTGTITATEAGATLIANGGGCVGYDNQGVQINVNLGDGAPVQIQLGQ